MAKFYGEVGYSEGTVESPPGSGVWVESIIERTYFGDETRPARQLREGEKVNEDLSTSTSISIVADAYAEENIFAMRYVRWKGSLWNVSNVDVRRPRLTLRLGGVYHGPTPPGAA